MLNQRIEYQSFYGTIKYIGPLLHTESPSDEIWLGIEWDDPTRGKHNGIVNETEYFKTKNETGGSLIKKEKVNFGLNVLKAILSKYFREDPEELYKQMEEMINNQENQMAIEENKENIEAITKQEAKQVLIEKNSTNEKVREVPTVEYDDEAYFETIKKHKKKVEFVGFDKIWKKINNLHEIQELSLPSLYISDIGPSGFLRRLTPNLKVLSLEKNLIFSWDQIFQIGHELPNLESLSISENKLNELENDVLYKENIRVLSAQTPNILINSKPVEAFKNLKTLILLDMGLNWKELNKVKAAFDKVEELILCRNELNDFENLEVKNKIFIIILFVH